VATLALDASVVIALLDEADAHHSRAVADLEIAVERGDDLVMAASAYAEASVHPLRELRDGLIDDFVDRLGIEVVAIDRSIARNAAALRAHRRSLCFPDALVLAAAHRDDARLLTFDESLRRLAASEPRG
jgi:predicted nucleic acid-binding protein